MINIENTSEESVKEQEKSQEDHPDEHGGILLQGFLKIHDPESGETILQGRA